MAVSEDGKNVSEDSVRFLLDKFPGAARQS